MNRNSVSVRLPTALQDLTGADEVTVDASTVAEVIDALEARHPGIRTRLLTPDGDIRPLVNVFYVTDNVRDLNGLQTDVTGGGSIQIIAAVAGG